MTPATSPARYCRRAAVTKDKAAAGRRLTTGSTDNAVTSPRTTNTVRGSGWALTPPLDAGRFGDAAQRLASARGDLDRVLPDTDPGQGDHRIPPDLLGGR